MSETGTTSTPSPGATAGEQLRVARERHGLSLDEVGARTRIPLRHLQAIEASDYAQLPSPTYAMGFAKAYARAVGADEVAVANGVRAEVARVGRRVPDYTPYEVADPARVPSRAVAVIGAGLALAILALVLLWYGSTVLRGGGGGGDTAGAGGGAQPAVAAGTVTTPVPAAQRGPGAEAGGQVTLTATDEVWLRVYDATNKVLFQGTMKKGDKYDVPPGANDPMINVGRPDKVAVTLNGSTAPAIGGDTPIKNIRIGAASVRARMNGEEVAPGSPVSPPDRDGGGDGAGARGGSEGARAPAPRRRLTETQRANLESARQLRQRR